MPKRRSEVYLATKTHDRTRDGSLRLLERSLELLKTDHIDLWQIHALSRMEQVEEVFAREAPSRPWWRRASRSIVRHLGVSGHADPDVLIAAIERFPFDAVLLTLNAADPHHLSFKERLLPLAVEKEMAIIGMKIPVPRAACCRRGRRREDPRRVTTAPNPGTLNMTEAMRYVLSLPVSTVIIGCDSISQLEENVQDRALVHPMNEKPTRRAGDARGAGPQTSAVLPQLGVVGDRHERSDTESSHQPEHLEIAVLSVGPRG